MAPKYVAGYRTLIGLSEALLEAYEKRTHGNGDVLAVSIGYADINEVFREIEPSRKFSLFAAALLADTLGYELKIELVKKG